MSTPRITLDILLMLGIIMFLICCIIDDSCCILTFNHKNVDIVEDLQQLAEHVRTTSKKYNLPFGPPPEWDDGSMSPISIARSELSMTAAAAFPIYTVDYSVFFDMSARAMQTIFREFPVVVVSGRPTRLRCNLNSLEEWGDVDALRVMHGQL